MLISGCMQNTLNAQYCSLFTAWGPAAYIIHSNIENEFELPKNQMMTHNIRGRMSGMEMNRGKKSRHGEKKKRKRMAKWKSKNLIRARVVPMNVFNVHCSMRSSVWGNVNQPKKRIAHRKEWLWKLWRKQNKNQKQITMLRRDGETVRWARER